MKLHTEDGNGEQLMQMGQRATFNIIVAKQSHQRVGYNSMLPLKLFQISKKVEKGKFSYPMI